MLTHVLQDSGDYHILLLYLCHGPTIPYLTLDMCGLNYPLQESRSTCLTAFFTCFYHHLH
jgi:hypothetical protein